MRKNQAKNRQKRKERNQLKAPVDRTKKRIEVLNSSIKTNIKLIMLFGFLFVLFFSVSLMSYHTDWWQNSEIIYRSHYYVEESTYRGVRTGAVRTGGYYVIVDEDNKSWRISWVKDFDKDIFEADVKPGDTLNISWYYWFTGRGVQSLESENHSYRSFSEAEKLAHDEIHVEITFTLISAVTLAITLKLLISHISEKRNLEVKVKEYEKNLEDSIMH